MDYQLFFNIAVGLSGALGGWALAVIWQAIRDMQKADKELAGKVSAIEVLVAGQYVTRADYQADLKSLKDDMNQGLRRIYDKLDGKADK